MSELIKKTITNNIEAEIAKEVDELIYSGELDKMIDEELKDNETFWDKVLNFLVKD